MTETFQHAEEHIVSHDDYDYYDVIIIKQLLSKSSSPNEAPKPKVQKGFKFLVYRNYRITNCLPVGPFVAKTKYYFLDLTIP